MTKKYKVIIGCQIEGTPAAVGDVVELNDRIADKLMNLVRPRIEEAKTRAKTKSKTKPKEDRAVGLPGTEDGPPTGDLETR